MLEVDLEPGEMLAEIQIANPKPHTGIAHEKLMVMQGDAGIVGAAVSITLKSGNGVCEDARIAISNAASTPLRAEEAEKRLIGKTITLPLFDEVGQVASQEADPPADVHGSAEYRREMIKVFVRRAAKKALERAKEG
jgi:CO/xanthine dehydrogenase FAD-binding subunit